MDAQLENLREILARARVLAEALRDDEAHEIAVHGVALLYEFHQMMVAGDRGDGVEVDAIEDKPERPAPSA